MLNKEIVACVSPETYLMWRISSEFLHIETMLTISKQATTKQIGQIALSNSPLLIEPKVQ